MKIATLALVDPSEPALSRCLAFILTSLSPLDGREPLFHAYYTVGTLLHCTWCSHAAAHLKVPGVMVTAKLPLAHVSGNTCTV